MPLRLATAEELAEINCQIFASMRSFNETKFAGKVRYTAHKKLQFFDEKGLLYGVFDCDQPIYINQHSSTSSIDIEGLVYDKLTSQLLLVKIDPKVGAIMHNPFGPALINFRHNHLYWYQNGIEHNTFGPAVILLRERRKLYAALGKRYPGTGTIAWDVLKRWMLTLVGMSSSRLFIPQELIEACKAEILIRDETETNLIESNKVSQQEVEEGEEITPMATEDKTLAEGVLNTLKSDSKKAAFRIAANKTARLIQETLVNFLTKDLKGKQKTSMKNMIVTALRSEQGDMAISFLIGMAMPYVAEKLPEKARPVALAMAEEFRVRAIASVGEKIVESGVMIAYEELSSNLGKILEPAVAAAEEETTTSNNSDKVRVDTSTVTHGNHSVASEAETPASKSHASGKSSRGNSHA